MPDGPHAAGERRAASPVMNLANAVSALRICAAPLAVWLVLDGDTGWAFVVFGAAGLSDALDGWLARRYGGSALGAMLDPAADKALVIGMVVALAAVGVLPGWIAAVVVARDAAILCGAALLWQRGRLLQMRPLRISKVNTALQLTLVGAALLLQGFGMPAAAEGGALHGLMLIVAVSTLVSGAAYVVRTLR